MKKKAIACIVNIIIIIISMYCAFNPSFLISNGYALSIDGVVISKALFFIFGLFSILKLFYFLISDKM